MYTPYPFERLPKLTRAQVHAAAELHSLFSDTDFAAALRTADTLLGLTLSCSVGVPATYSGATLASRTSAPSAAISTSTSWTTWIWIELTVTDAWATREDNSVWLELPIGLCELLTERTLGGDPAIGMSPSGAALDELALGALAYLAARVCAAAGTRFRLRAVSATLPPIAAGLFVGYDVMLRSADEAASFRFYAAASLLHEAQHTRPVLRRLSTLSLVLWAEAGSALIDRGALDDLGLGDVIVLQHTGLHRETPRDEYEGAVEVRVQGSACKLRCRLRAGRLEVETIACSAEPGMTSGRRIPDNAPLGSASEEGSALGRDAPIELALEIARFQLSLGELERVRAGDVLATGRRVGDRVTLRAANQALAEGELVEVEGELGVRITRLLI
jgi:type III secretion system YscQ/HrcQ family protein